MLKSHVAPASHGFRHICRSLQEGEALPRLPSLTEQVLACRFILPGDEEETVVEESFADEDVLDEEFAEAA